MIEQQTILDTLVLPEDLVKEMALSAERLWRLLEVRNKLVKEKQTIDESLNRLIREENEHYRLLEDEGAGYPG